MISYHKIQNKSAKTFYWHHNRDTDQAIFPAMFHLILKLIVHIAYWYAGQYQSGTIHQITLSGLEPADYRIRLIAEGDPGDRKVYRRSFTLPENPLDCLPYLTGEGISIDGDTVTFTFTSTGVYSSFSCQLDRNQPFSCKLTFQSAMHKIEYV